MMSTATKPVDSAPKVYLAGPDVFRPDAAAFGRQLQAQCCALGLEGLFPLDQSPPVDVVEPSAQAEWIYKANLALIERADMVLANLDFFRGPEPDSGTCFEVGYAVARGKLVYGYLPDAGSLAERIARHHGECIGKDGRTDGEGWLLEDFGLPLNLMLAVPTKIIVGDALHALRVLAMEWSGCARPDDR